MGTALSALAKPQDIQVLPQDMRVFPQDIQVPPQNTQVPPQDIQVLPQNTEVLQQAIQDLPPDSQGAPQTAPETPPRDPLQRPVNTLAMAVSPRASGRSPAALIDDLVEVAAHTQNQSLGGQSQPLSEESRKSKNKATLQHSIPDVININYRPARAAAQIYMRHGSEDAAAGQLDQAKLKDQLTVLISAVILDLVTGLGERATKREQSDSTMARAIAELSNLVGPQEANWALVHLEKFGLSVAMDSTSGEGETSTLPAPIEVPAKFSLAWDVLGQERLANAIAKRAIAHDQTVANLKAQLGVHENPPAPFEKTLSLLSMIPEVVATAALVGDQVLEMSNGGTREKRLTDVMSLGMQLDSREAALTRQSYLAATSINGGKMTGNQVLAAFASAMAVHLCGQ